MLLGGLTGISPATTAVTEQRSNIELQPTESIADCQLAIALVIVGLIKNGLAGTTRLELANQLIEGQPAFHFAFIPVRNV